MHYTDRSFLGIMELSPGGSPYFNTGDLTSNLTDFDQIWESLMDRLVREAAAGTSRLKFSSDDTKLTSFRNIYALVQCLRKFGIDCRNHWNRNRLPESLELIPA